MNISLVSERKVTCEGKTAQPSPCFQSLLLCALVNKSVMLGGVSK